MPRTCAHAVPQNVSYGGNDSDGEAYTPRTPRRTPMACVFCRGRKLKCDGRTTCANCHKRGLLCSYVPV
ncbi:uncharacterized protein PHACADRAFT_90860 [Phanerochaete carnosa HHB-10118-sp]|uniref:Zn(2)-C6 fungal-type domain-containing protein n=1 Tax=Phanerochaete carnosa (strain HHB-10118-sp) TaxID=650164 RepID=K5X6L5_PHACS|nr:uncharacterized protein PHACADRAFT_90860 [Phanerochaete carnosa HHB-10118-sp]EKM58517.1 hypothetical protein PHACADRAFT_90860 [Phanerochaete carnosa HHB-10118-sp]